MPGNYEYSIEDQYECSGPNVLDEDEPHMVALLLWIKQTYVDFTSDSRVIYQEELRYLVREHTLENANTKWCCKLKVFNVRDQIDQVISFQLKRRMTYQLKHPKGT